MFLGRSLASTFTGACYPFTLRSFTGIDLNVHFPLLGGLAPDFYRRPHTGPGDQPEGVPV